MKQNQKLKLTALLKKEKKCKKFPSSPGVYLFKDAKGTVLYVGKASSLKTRVSSYFQKAHDVKTELLIRSIASVDCEQTDTLLEATFREAELIKKFQPKYNIQQKDDKSFIYVGITKDAYPRVLMVRGRELQKLGEESYKATFGPFASAELLRSLLKLVRKIIPFSTCAEGANRPCFYYHLGTCPGVCTGEISKKEYNKIINNVILFFRGRKKRVIQNLKREMKGLAKQEKFEAAAKIRNQLYNLKHIQDSILLKREVPPKSAPFMRIEGYDISNISGAYATGSMVVFEKAEPNKKEYRRFKIKTIRGSNDVGMLKEVLLRRLKHSEWSLPHLILIDGGRGQVNAAQEVLKGAGLDIPVLGLAKGPNRKKVIFYFGKMEGDTEKHIRNLTGVLIRVRDEAHRFAVSYHRHLRNNEHLTF